MLYFLAPTNHRFCGGGRFLPTAMIATTLENSDFWTVLVDNVKRGCDEIILAMTGEK